MISMTENMAASMCSSNKSFFHVALYWVAKGRPFRRPMKMASRLAAGPIFNYLLAARSASIRSLL